jgi:AcrR family transcriptional regulator
MKNDSETSSHKTPRGAKRRARTRAELLTAARKVFAQQGYHNASILDITAEADVGVGTFYLHFKDKDDAFNTLIDEVLQIIEEKVIREVRSQNTFSLAVIVHSVFFHAYENRDLFRIALTGGGNVKSYLCVETKIEQGMARAFEQVEDRTIFAGQDLSLLAHLVTGIIAQGITWWFDHDDPKPEQMANQILHLLQNGLPATLFLNHEEQQ